MGRVAWGIDIGDASLKAVKLELAGKRIRLLDLRVLPYSEIGTGSGRPREAFRREAVVALKGEALKRDRCVVSLPTRSVFSRFFALPPLERRIVPEVIAYESRQQMPYVVEEVVWAYHILGGGYVPGEQIEIALFAVKRDLIESFLGEIECLRKQIARLQLGPIGLYNFARHEAESPNRFVALNVGAGSTDFVVVDGERFWVRTIPIGGARFTEAIAKALDLPTDKAEEVKRRVAESPRRAEILDALRPVALDLAVEIEGSLEYYRALTQHSKYEEIVLHGFGSRLWGLCDLLSQRLRHPVRVASEAHGVVCEGSDALKGQFQDHLPGLGLALGLALQGLGCAAADLDLRPSERTRAGDLPIRHVIAPARQLAKKIFGRFPL